jgi:putative ABC transport system permease protein
MDWKRAVRDRIAGLDVEPWRSEEIAEELAQDLEARFEAARARGLDEAQARQATLDQLDDPQLLPALVRAEGTALPALARPQGGRHDALVEGAPASGLLHGLRQDVRYALRTLLRTPGFSAVAIVTLGLGIGASTAIFGIAEAVLLRPLPYDQPERLQHLFETRTSQDFARSEASYPDFVDWSSRRDLFDAVAGYDGGGATLNVSGTPERVRVLSVTDEFFPMLGVRPALGRLFLPGDSGAADLVVLSWNTWQSRFGGDPAVLGRSLSLSERAFTVVGVLPESFSFPLRGDVELWLPLRVSENRRGARGWHWLDAIARLRPGVTREQALQGLRATAAQIAESDPRWHHGHGITLVPLRDEMVGNVKPALLALMATVAFVLLIVCSNLANLLLVRAAARRRELALRAALGASRWRLARQVLCESLAIAALGGLLALGVARTVSAALIAGLPGTWAQRLPFLDGFAISLPAVAFTLAVAVASGLLFGLAPMLRATRFDVFATLKEGRGSIGSAHGRLSRLFVVSEVALTLVLLVAGGLVARSFLELMRVSPGFETENLLTAGLSLPATRYRDPATLRAAQQRLIEGVESIPGAVRVATVSQLPLTGRGDTGGFKVAGRPEDERTEVNLRTVSRSYFDTLGVRLAAGRAFAEGDGPDAPPVVIVNETLARRVFPGGALGQRISFTFFEGEPWWEIVGVVGDERVDQLDKGVTPIVYFAYAQAPDNSMALVVRSAVAPEALAKEMREVVRGLDPELPLQDVTTMEQRIADSLPVFLRRYLALLIGAFAALAAVLAGVGIYGVAAHAVEQRQHEIGVRMALGAAPGQVVGMILGQALALAGVGVAIGLAGSALASRALSGLLYGVASTDALVHAAVAGALATVVVAACARPAWRAVRVDPTIALRAD